MWANMRLCANLANIITRFYCSYVILCINYISTFQSENNPYKNILGLGEPVQESTMIRQHLPTKKMIAATVLWSDNKAIRQPKKYVKPFIHILYIVSLTL